MQSNWEPRGAAGLHVAIIMDGNGRWACARGLPRVTGHRAGAAAVRRVVEAAPGLGIGVLTLFAFSSDNWQRPSFEVATLMRLFHEYLRSEQPRCVTNGIRLRVIGRRDRFSQPLLGAVEACEAATAAGRAMDLRIAMDYSARDAIHRAARRLGELATPTRETFERLLGEAINDAAPVSDVDLLIRTSGEQRLSDFLLWECAYAELYFTERMWPEFDARDLESAVQEFHSRERRFGRVVHSAVG